MTDISKCQNTDCPSHMQCWRYLAPGSEYQYYSDFKPEEGQDKCEYFEQVDWHYSEKGFKRK